MGLAKVSKIVEWQQIYVSYKNWLVQTRFLYCWTNHYATLNSKINDEHLHINRPHTSLYTWMSPPTLYDFTFRLFTGTISEHDKQAYEVFHKILNLTSKYSPLMT